jgi:hypothetical protein
MVVSEAFHDLREPDGSHSGRLGSESQEAAAVPAAAGPGVALMVDGQSLPGLLAKAWLVLGSRNLRLSGSWLG